MAEFDAELRYGIMYYVLPVLVLFYCVCHLKSKIKKAKIEAWCLNFFCGWVHRKFCDNEKRLLFHQMIELKEKAKSPLQILEIGVGSGMNFKFYPRGSHLTCVDPNPFHEAYIHKNLKKANNHLNFKGFIKSFAENMPKVESNSYDVVVCTLTLCTVRNPTAVLGEIKRVLKPGGTFFYMEHVAGPRGSFVRWFQNKLQYIWPYFSGGCSINRETWTHLDNSGFRKVSYRHYSVNTWVAFFAKHLLYGTAVK